jgi:hypothetical protein
MTAMRNNILSSIITAAILISVMSSCKQQEQELSDGLKGKWNVSEIRFNSDSLFNDFSNGKHTIEFFGGERAYTATMIGVYTIDYTDANLKDLTDTFRYDIKGDQIAVTYTKSTTVRNLIRYRYKIETLSSTDLYFNKTPLDTTNAYLKAFK